MSARGGSPPTSVTAHLALDTVAAVLEEELPERAPRLLVALSGGSDSVALASLLRTWRDRHRPEATILLGHLDHGLRGRASRQDASWCRELACRLGLPIETGAADVAAGARDTRDSIEMAGRAARYHFLEEVAALRGCTVVLTAHHRDDQVETILARVLRESGHRGWTGIPRRRPISAGSPITLLRPCLDLTRDQLRDWRTTRGIEHREDPSNGRPIADRNRLRLEVLPALRRSLGPEIDARLLALGRGAGRVLTRERRLIYDWADAVLRTGDHRSLPPAMVAALAGSPRGRGELGALLGEGWPGPPGSAAPPRWRRSLHTAWRGLFTAGSPGGAIDLPGPWRALRCAGWIHWLRVGEEAAVPSREFHAEDGARQTWGEHELMILEAAAGALRLRGVLPGDRWAEGGRAIRLAARLRRRGVPSRLHSLLPVLSREDGRGERLVWIPEALRGANPHPERPPVASLRPAAASLLEHLLTVITHGGR
ncbi:MAG: tRNA lysidine(34) synthetase TilS [Planctomycetota bacterium]